MSVDINNLRPLEGAKDARAFRQDPSKQQSAILVSQRIVRDVNILLTNRPHLVFLEAAIADSVQA